MGLQRCQSNRNIKDLKYSKIKLTTWERSSFLTVPGHTGWDHTSKTSRILFKKRFRNIDPIDLWTGESFGWTDVVDLNYDNVSMRQAMKEAMLYWIKEVDIDGYRIDQAYAVPMDFYEEVPPEMKKLKPVFILGETDANHPGEWSI